MGWIVLALVLLLPGIAEAGKAQGAFWRSLLVPGWGQQYARGGGGGFLAAELALWGGYWGFEWLGEVRRDRYEAYAAERAGARPEGKGRDYFDDLGFYASRLQHNQFARYEDGPEAALYPVEADFFWEWDRDESRLHYRELRNASRHAQRQALYVNGIGGRQSPRGRHPCGAGGQRGASSDRLRAQGGGGAGGSGVFPRAAFLTDGLLFLASGLGCVDALAAAGGRSRRADMRDALARTAPCVFTRASPQGSRRKSRSRPY